MPKVRRSQPRPPLARSPGETWTGSSARPDSLPEGGEVGGRVAALLDRVAEREAEQPQRGLLVHGQVVDGVDGVLDVDELRAGVEQICDLVAVARESRHLMGAVHIR